MPEPSPYRVAPAGGKRKPTMWLVIVDQSPFMPQFELGAFRWRWAAIVRGWIYTVGHVYSACEIVPADEQRAARIRTELDLNRQRFYW